MPETHLEFSVPLRKYPDSQSHVLILPSAAQQLRLVRSCASFCPCAHLADSSRTSPEVREVPGSDRTQRSSPGKVLFSVDFFGPGAFAPGPFERRKHPSPTCAALPCPILRRPPP